MSFEFLRKCLGGQQYDGTGSLGTFLTKFQCMASYLWMIRTRFTTFGQPGGAVGQVLWDIGPCAMTADIVCVLQTRFGTQLQAERFKAELRERKRAPGESIQQLYQDIDWSHWHTRLLRLH